MGREIGISGILTKTCEKCHGNGTITQQREALMDDLTDTQSKLLLHADIYRETGGEEAKKQHEQAKKMQRRGAGGVSPSSTPSVPSGSTPTTPNF